MEDFFTYDEKSIGSKGLIIVGDKLLVYRRDENTTSYPLQLDLPGGGPEGNETPFETFQREVKEEFDLTITRNDIAYVRQYQSTVDPNKVAYFPVAQLEADIANTIHFGDEGIEFMFFTIDEYLNRKDAWPVFQDRTRDYFQSLSK